MTNEANENKNKNAELILNIENAVFRFLGEGVENRPKQTNQRDSKNFEWPNQQCGNFLNRMNALLSSATPKDLQDHRGQLQWMIAEFFPLL